MFVLCDAKCLLAVQTHKDLLPNPAVPIQLYRTFIVFHSTTLRLWSTLPFLITLFLTIAGGHCQQIGSEKCILCAPHQIKEQNKWHNNASCLSSKAVIAYGECFWLSIGPRGTLSWEIKIVDRVSDVKTVVRSQPSARKVRAGCTQLAPFKNWPTKGCLPNGLWSVPWWKAGMADI